MTATLLLTAALLGADQPDLTPEREKLGERIEGLMVTTDQDAAIARAEASGKPWVRWTYWPDVYDASTELFNELPGAVHVLKECDSGADYVQFRHRDGVKRWLLADRIDKVGGKAVAAGIRAQWPGPAETVMAVSDGNGETEKVTVGGKVYDKHPDGRLTWCEECNGGPDPDPAKTARMNVKAKATDLDAPKPAPTPAQSSTDRPLTYAEAYRKAHGGGNGRKAKPLVIWVGGNFCERCVRESENDFVHYFAPSWPGMKAPSILVTVWDETDFYVAGKIDWWIEGDREFGHLATIRNAIRKWRDDRDRGLAGNAAHRAKFAAKNVAAYGGGQMTHASPMMQHAPLVTGWGGDQFGYGGGMGQSFMPSMYGKAGAGMYQSFAPPQPARMMAQPRMSMSAGVPLRGG